MDYVEPDNINDALEMMERWGYSDGDILAHMLDDMDNELFLSKVAGVLTVESALQLVKDVYGHGQVIQIRNTLAKDNQIKELREKIQQLEESNDESSTTNQADGVE
jgi:hypothetical protein